MHLMGGVVSGAGQDPSVSARLDLRLDWPACDQDQPQGFIGTSSGLVADLLSTCFRASSLMAGPCSVGPHKPRMGPLRLPVLTLLT